MKQWNLDSPDMLTGAIQLSNDNAERVAFIPRNKLSLDEHLARCNLVASSPVMLATLAILYKNVTGLGPNGHDEVREGGYGTGKPQTYQHDPACRRCLIGKAIKAANPLFQPTK